MPIYVFACQDCCEEYHAIRSVDDRNAEFTCPGCHATLSRLITSADFRMKGGTRNHNRFPVVPLETRLNSKYGDNR